MRVSHLVIKKCTATLILMNLCVYSTSTHSQILEVVPGSHYQISEWFYDDALSKHACVTFAASYGRSEASCHHGAYEEFWGAGWFRVNYGSKPFYYGKFYHDICQDDEYIDRGVGCRKLTLPPFRKQLNVNQCLDNPVIGNPIILSIGNKHQRETDYKTHQSFGLNFIRYFNSGSLSVDFSIGSKWGHIFLQKIIFSNDKVYAYRNSGEIYTYIYDGNVWHGDVDIPDTLVEVRDSNDIRTGWVYTDSADAVEVYNSSGQLLSISNRAGLTQFLYYEIPLSEGGDYDSTTLDKVMGPYGEILTFNYDNNQRISSMTDPEGQIYTYAYDAVGNLVSVAYPDNTPADNADNPTRLYHYENTDFPHHLTGITDENGQRYATWTYDTEGRAISSEHADGVDNTTLAFHTDGSVTTTNPLGKDTTYHFTTLHGVKRVTQVEGHATESCAGANQNYTYDANGYLASKTDWQGNVTTYTHNSRGLEISRTEAVGTPAERTITTQWHEDFRLPTQITEPGKVTTYSYDASGNQISQSITAQ